MRSKGPPELPRILRTSGFSSQGGIPAKCFIWAEFSAVESAIMRIASLQPQDGAPAQRELLGEQSRVRCETFSAPLGVRSFFRLCAHTREFFRDSGRRVRRKHRTGLYKCLFPQRYSAGGRRTRSGARKPMDRSRDKSMCKSRSGRGRRRLF